MSSRQPRIELTPVILGIDIGSTSLRAVLWDAMRPDKESPVLGSYSKKAPQRYEKGDFDTTCCVDINGLSYRIPIPENTELIRAKALMYVLCGTQLDRQRIFDQSPILASLEDYRGRSFLDDAIISVLSDIFRALHRRIEHVCKQYAYRIDAIAMSVPTQWTEKFELTYRSIVSNTFNFPSDRVCIYTETLSLSRYLIGNHAALLGLGLNTMILILDFGGHSLNYCTLFAKQDLLQDEHAAYFRCGEAKGFAGGSENWEHELWKVALDKLSQGGKVVQAISKNYVCDRLNEKKREFYSGKETSDMTITYQQIRIASAVVDRKYEETIGPLVVKALRKIRKFVLHVNNLGFEVEKRVIVSGGTSKIPKLQRKLDELVIRESPQITTRRAARPVSTPEYMQQYGIGEIVPCLAEHELRFVEECNISNSSSKIAQGAAIIAGSSMTVLKYLEQGAVFGFQQKRRGQVWSHYAQIALRKRAKTKFLCYKPTRKDDGITFRGEDMEVLKIVCSPFFFSTHRHPRRRNYAGEKKSQQTRTFPIDTAYDVKKLHDFPPGLWRYSLQWTDETCTGVKLIRETKDPGCFRYRFVDETVESVYFDKSENCTHFGEQWQDDEDDDDGDEQDE